MYGRSSLDRFKKAQSLEPFSVAANSAPKTASQPSPKPVTHSHSHPNQQPQHHEAQSHAFQKPACDAAPAPAPSVASIAPQVTVVGGGQSTWQPPDWAIEPRPGVYFLEVLKDGEVLDRVSLDKRKHIFGRQFHTCDFVLDHQSVSRQHAAVVPHKNGSVYVIDLGSAHGTFVANERLTKETPVELEVGQSLRFAASTRSYILRKNEAALFPPPTPTLEINLPPPPDPSDEEAVVAYNTLLNRYGISKLDASRRPARDRDMVGESSHSQPPAKRMRKMRVAFRDQVGGDLVEVVGVSDGADVETEPGPLGLKEGSSLVGKYESLVQITVIPKGKGPGKGQPAVKEDNNVGVTDKLQQVLNKVKNAAGTCKSKSGGGIYDDDLYGESFSGKVGSSWAGSSVYSAVGKEPSQLNGTITAVGLSNATPESNTSLADDDDDDLFGD